MILAVRYAASHKSEWDEFVARSKNGTFLFRRDYLEYHADRFSDHSLLFYQEQRLIALLPAAERGGVLSSHGGLTYGGVVTDAAMTVDRMLEVFSTLRTALLGLGAERVTYKPVPHIYHRIAAEEDLYALFRCGGRLVRRDASCSLVPAAATPLSKGRKWAITRAKRAGLEVRRSWDFASFMAIESELLRQKYGVMPVHTTAEIETLAGRFPDNIQLFAAYDGERMLAGVLVYESDRVAHAQYIASTEEGRERFALDATLHYLLAERYAAKPIFDFGISTEKQGTYLNVGLARNKESWGGRTTVYDEYELDLLQAI